MTSYDPNRRLAVRRSTLSLPSRRHHLSLALIALLILIATPVIFARFFGEDSDAQPRGSVSVASIPDSDLPSPLDASSDTLPDLLSGSVAEGDNPTDTLAAIDALGNPMGEKPAPTPRAAVRQPTQPKAPPLDPSVTRQSDFGLIPGPNDAGRTPLEVYRNTPPSTTTRVPVSVIVGGLGINGSLTQRAIDELPAAVTLSFAAQSPSLQSWIDRARARGHEVLLEIPMQGESFASGGPGTDRTLRTSLNPAENRRHLHYLLSRGQGYAGVINYQGDLLLRRSDVTGPILTELKASGLGLFIDGSFDAPTVGALAQSVSLPFKAGFGLIDPDADLNIINAQLDALTETAKETPGAVGVGFVYPQTINAVKGWAATLSAQGLVLVPATSSLK